MKIGSRAPGTWLAPLVAGSARLVPLTAFALALLGGAGLADAKPREETGWGMPFDASADGHRIDWLINVTTIFVVILFVIMCIWIVAACVKHREGVHEKADYDHGDSKHAVKFAFTLSTVIFLIVDGNLFVNSMVDLDDAFWNFKEPLAEPGAVRIEINAHQWAWDARYPGPDGEFNTTDDVVTLNDIRVPIEAPVVLQIASVDVIHSFSLPNFRIKQDATPGLINQMWFRAKVLGEYDIGCTQHCGTAHYKMRGKLTVLPREEYDAWVAQMSADSVRRFEEAAKSKQTERILQAQWGWKWREI